VGAALRPPPRDLVLLANTGFVRKPDFYFVAVTAFSRAMASRRAAKF
jgi:hypothetical protein